MKTLVTSPVASIPAKNDISRFQTFARRLLLSQMAGLQHGRISFEDRHGRQEFGKLTERCSLNVHITVHDPEFYTDVVFGGTIGAGETFMNAYWSCDRLTDLVRIFVINRELLNGMEKGLARLMAPLGR